MLPQSSGGTRGHPDDEQADVKDRARAATLASPARVVTPHAASSFRCETGVERDRVPSSGSRPTLSGRSYTGPSKPEARRCRSGSTRGSRPGRRLTKRGARHTVDVCQRPARRSTGRGFPINPSRIVPTPCWQRSVTRRLKTTAAGFREA
jgi:hypothetical protein